ncbi:MAG TPA: IPT/TIG domain-containing protein [Thermoanaerobaculia bacterium]|nr:IPT/TIG domain-containing protein [Thermoanaerobaculia bacterium]
MRRIFLLLSLIALAVGFQACAADAPAPTPPGGNGSTANSALQVRVFTNNANPAAGFCSTIQAIVTLNGASVPDGTGVIFSTDFGTFQQNGLPLISAVTQNGTALTALCSTAVGVARVKASVTIGSRTASSSIGISFQPLAQTGPFFAFCSPSFGPNTGGTLLTISGGRFFGNATSTRVQFTVFGITREGVVQAGMTATALTVLTPAFPEAMSPSVPVDIAVIFGTNTGAPITLAVPNCFVYGTFLSDQPTITAVLPSTGSNDGGTRVTIIGSGFLPPMQVFFGTIEAAPPISVIYNQIVVLSPAASGPGLPNLNKTVTIRVRNTTSGRDGTLPESFTFVTKLQITAFRQAVGGAFSPVTIFGNGFSSPMAVSLAGVTATISSVSATELVVIPGLPLGGLSADPTGPVQVTNISNGDSATGPTFTYLVKEFSPVISGVSPSSGPSGTTITISGLNFAGGSAGIGRVISVKIGARPASFTVLSDSVISATVPDPGTAPPACPTGTPAGTPLANGAADILLTANGTGCTALAPAAFLYLVPCVASPPDLAIVKTSNPASVSLAGSTAVAYNLAVTNSGGTAAATTVVTDTLPAGVTFVSCVPTQGVCSGALGTVTANLGVLAASGSANVTINVTMAGPARTVTNTATVSTSTPEPATANNTSTATTTVTP